MEILNRYYIRMAVVLLALSLGISSCSDGGGATDPGDPPPDPEPTPTTITSSFKSEDTNFLPGQIQFIRLNNFTADANEYSAQLDNGTAITLKANPASGEDHSLLFLVPEETTGSYTLTFSLDGQEQSLNFKIKAYEPIDNPSTYTTNFMDNLSSEFQQLINETENGAFKDRLVVAMDSLKQKKAEINSLSDQEMKLLARIISTHFAADALSNEISVASNSPQFSDLSCPDNLPKRTLSAAIGAGVSLYAFSLSGTIAASGWGLLVGGVTGAISGTALYISLKSFKTNYNKLWDCKTEYLNRSLSALSDGISLKQPGSSSQQLADALDFQHGSARSFQIQASFEVPANIQDAITKFKEYLNFAIELLPDSWIETINRDYVVEEADDPAGIEIQNISDSRISGTAVKDNDRLAINLSYDKNAILDPENKNFTFELAKNGYESVTVTSTLKPLAPVALEKQMKISDDSTTVSGTLAANYAAGFAIEGSPSNGTVTLDNPKTGAFTYQPDEGYTGDDSFTFSATNSAGTSEVATVIVRGTEYYELQIGVLRSDFTKINPLKTIRQGDDLKVPNNMFQMVRLTLNGEAVKVGKLSLDWTEYKFGDTPVSGENVVLNDYKVNILDATNGKKVTIKLGKLTLTNAAYDAIVGKKAKATSYIDGEPVSDGYKILTFNTDGTLNSVYADGSGEFNSDYSFYANFGEEFIQCDSYSYKASTIGTVKVYVTLPGEVIRYINLYEDGSIGARCFDYEDPSFNSFKIEYVN